MNFITDNNLVNILGKISSEIKESHVSYGEKFYEFTVDVNRFSKSIDTIPVILSERLIDCSTLKQGDILKIAGELRSYNSVKEDTTNKLKILIFSKEIEVIEDKNVLTNQNNVILNGFLCKNPIYRSTPLGREICDAILAVNRNYHKSDYIPVISWGRNAKFLSQLSVGDNIEIEGRLQSRLYEKKFENGESETRVAYEVSVSKIKYNEMNNTKK